MKTFDKLTELEALRELFVDKRPGYDLKVLTRSVMIGYGSIEAFLEAEIARTKEAIRQHYLAVFDEE